MKIFFVIVAVCLIFGLSILYGGDEFRTFIKAHLKKSGILIILTIAVLFLLAVMFSTTSIKVF